MPAPTEVMIDLSLYESQLRILQGDPNTRVVGSLGRMVACQEVLGNPFQEFEDRRAVGMYVDTVSSDIDVLGTSQEVVLQAISGGNAYIDDRAFRDSDVTIDIDGGAWYLRSRDADFEERIKDELMKPVSGSVNGVEIVTIPLLTHQILHLLRERGSRKDRLSEQTIGYMINTVAQQTGVIPHLSRGDSLPFRQLQTKLQLLRHATGSTGHYRDERHSR